MASVPQIAVICQDDNYPDNSSCPPPDHPISPCDIPDFSSLPIPIPKNSRHYLNVPGSSGSHTSDPSSSQLHPSLTLSANSSASIRLAASAVLLNNNPEEHDGLSSSRLLTPPPRGHCRRQGCTVTLTSISSNSDINGSSSLGLGPVRSCHSDKPIPPRSATNIRVDAGFDTSRLSSVAGFFKNIVRSARKRGCASARPDSADVDANVEPFAFKPPQLVALVHPKSLENLESLGGVDGLLRGLGTDRLRGLNTKLKQGLKQLGSPDPETNNAVTLFGMELTPTSDVSVSEGLQSATSLGGSGVGRSFSLKISAPYEATIEDRQRIYGQNILPQRPSKPLLLLMWFALHDKVLVLLSIATVAALTLGIYLDFSSTRAKGDPTVDWAEGIAIIVAILIVVFVSSLNNRLKERQVRALNEKKDDRLVKVIRDGGERQIRAHEIVVGDVVLLEPGNVIPCDGVFLSGHNVRCDESNSTGYSDQIKKLSYEGGISFRDKRLTELDPGGHYGDGELLGRADCFIVSGSKVLEGVGSYVVIAVGTKSLAFSRDPESTPLKLKLNDLADASTEIGGIAGGLLFVALLIRYFFELGTKQFHRTPGEMGVAFINILNMAVTLVVVALPKGLPLAVTLALAFVTKQMTKQNLLVRVLGSCETMANATVICTGKTGTLTQNEMTVVAGTVGVQAKFVRRLEVNRKRVGSEARSNLNAKEFDVDLANLNAVLPHPLKDLFNTAIAINSTAFEDVDLGNKTESALLEFAMELGWPNYKDAHPSVDIVQMIPFSSHRKFMSCVVRLTDGCHRLYVKGASEILARNCTRHVVLAPGANEVVTAPIGELEEVNISRTITSYASQTLRTITLCYRDFPSWPPKGERFLDKDEVDYDDLTADLTLISIIGIEDPLRTGVLEAVANCGKAGVRVKLCTGDNVLTAKSIAQQCGIYTPGGIVMEGPLFRTLSPGVMKTILPRLQVLARSSPEDKRILVETLKELGDVVGVTGGGTNDGPALKTADVGFSMGIAGTEVAKEASNVVLMDDKISSIVSAIMWGRCVNDSVRKFLQLLITGKVTAIVTTFVWALASEEEEPVLSAVQLLWVDLVMDTLAAPMLATDPASPAVLERKPDKKADPLFTVDKIKQILGQAFYQIAVILIFHFLGSEILGFHPTDEAALQKHHDDIVRTLIFNAFVFAQIFNSFNCRRLDSKLNVFEGMTKNWYFMAIAAIEVAVQVLVCFFGGSAFDVTRMGAREWVISLALGCIPLPLGALIRLIPNEPCERAFKKLQLLPAPELLPTTRPDAVLGSSFAMNHVRDMTRRGCMHGSSLVRKRRCAIPDTDSPRLASAMVPSLEASPSSSRPLSDPGIDRPRSSLWENGFEVHPDTPRDDPVYRLLGITPLSVMPL